MPPSPNPVRDALLADIRRAFADVSRGEGVSLHEADVIDDYGSAEERAEARKLDRDEFWWDVPDTNISRFYSALSFLDPAGLHYYIPAYMSWTLRHYETSESATLDSAVYALTLSNDPTLIDWQRERLSVFTAEQGAVISRFLKFMAEVWDDRTPSATERFWSP